MLVSFLPSVSMIPRDLKNYAMLCEEAVMAGIIIMKNVAIRAMLS